MIFSKNMLDSF